MLSIPPCNQRKTQQTKAQADKIKSFPTTNTKYSMHQSIMNYSFQTETKIVIQQLIFGWIELLTQNDFTTGDSIVCV